MDQEATLRMVTVRGILGLIKDQVEHGSLRLAQIGASEAAIRLVSQPSAWTAQDRSSVSGTVDSLWKGTCVLAGVPVVDVSAEVVAAVIATIVHPCNWMVASSLAALRPANAEMIEDPASRQGVRPERVFAVLCELYEDPTARDTIADTQIALGLREALKRGDIDETRQAS